jgi:predicted RecA/RadA family phage recombinase
MKNFVQPGDTITITAPTSITSDDFVAIGSLFGFAVTSAASGEDVSIRTTGVFETAVSSSAPVTVGAQIFWSGETLTTASTDGDAEAPTAFLMVGVAVSPASAGAAVTVHVKI